MLKAYRVKIELEVMIPSTSVEQATANMETSVNLWITEPLMGLNWIGGKVHQARRAKDLDVLIFDKEPTDAE